MRKRYFAPVLGGLLFFGCSPAGACEPVDLIEEMATDAAFIGRVVPVSTIAVGGSDGLPDRFETRALITDRVRGSSGRVTLVSWELLPEQEILVFANDCGAMCETSDAYWVSGTVPLDLAASATLSGDWFEMTSNPWAADFEALGAKTLERAGEPRQVVSWRAFEEMIGGADAYVACRDRVADGYARPVCEELPGDEQTACWEATWEGYERELAACRR